MSYREESDEPSGPLSRATASLARVLGFEDDGPQLLLLLSCLFILPTVGLLVSYAFAAGDEAKTVFEMAMGSYALGALIFLTIIGAPKLAGTNRARMSLVFGPFARLMMLLLAGSVLLQAGLFIYSLFTLEASTIGRVHGGLMVVVGLGALYACYALIVSAVALFKVQPMALRAVASTSAELRSRIDAIASKLGSQSPHNIIVGLEPNFFITSAPVKLIGTGEELRGTSLFVSLSLMRIFSNEEFNAVIGHELGHFRGSDTVYSLKFAPTYSRLSHALGVLSNTAGNASDLGKLPALAALALYLTRFAVAERRVGREREMLADQAGASVGGERALATALLKVALFSANWNWLTQQHIAALAEGQTFTHLATTFSASAELAPDVNWPELRNAVAAVVQVHPTDTHPTFSERVSALGLSPDALESADCSHPAESCVTLVEGCDELDAELSGLEANWLLAVGAAQLPQAA